MRPKKSSSQMENLTKKSIQTTYLSLNSSASDEPRIIELSSSESHDIFNSTNLTNDTINSTLETTLSTTNTTGVEEGAYLAFLHKLFFLKTNM